MPIHHHVRLTPVEWIKLALWAWLIAPFFPYVQRVLLILRVIRHHGRQPFLFGWIRPGRTLHGFFNYLTSQGFHNHFIAWKDDGELMNLRRMDGFANQYHLRIFADGEVRGHYEKTPEDHPFDHFNEVGFEERREEFLSFLGDWVLGERPVRKRLRLFASATSRGRDSACVIDRTVSYEAGRESGKTISQSAPATSLRSPTNG